MDEAAIRVIVEGLGDTTGAAEQQPQAPPVPPQSVAQAQTQPPQRTDTVLNDARAALVALGEKKAVADSLVAKLAASGKQFASVQDALVAAYKKPAGSDPVMDTAKDRLEKDKKRAAVDNEYAKITKVKPPFDPVVEAQKRLDADKQRAEIDKAYAKLAPFDPTAEARKRREMEKQRSQIDAAYKNLYGDPGVKSNLDTMLGIANQFRGTIGGLAGTIVGSALDALVSFRKTQADITKQGFAAGSQAAVLNVTPGGQPSMLAQRGPQAGSVPQPAGTSQQGVPQVVPAGTIQKALPAGTIPQALPAGGGAAASGGGLAAGAAAAVPYVAVAVAAKEMSEKINKSIIGGIRDMVGGAGRIASGIASSSDDPAAVVGVFGDVVSRSGEKLTEYNRVLGFATVAVGETGKAFADLMQAIDKTATRYGEYSPAIAQQQALVDVRRTMGDFRRAQEAGQDLARYVQAQGELQQKFEDIKIKLLTKILAVVNPMLELLERVVPSGQGIENAINALLTPLMAIPGVSAMIQTMINNQSQPPTNDPTSVLFSPGLQLPVAGETSIPQ